MFASWKEKLTRKKAKEKAIAESRRWKDNALLQDCLQAMRGNCTVAPMDMHEAAITAVNIALQENSWTQLDELIDIPDDFFADTLFIVWDDETLPVLKTPGFLADKCLPDVQAVSNQTFLMAETMDRIIWFDAHNRIRLYSIA